MIFAFQFDDVESAVTTKLKGVAFTNFSDEELIGVPQEWKHLYRLKIYSYYHIYSITYTVRTCTYFLTTH